MKYICPEAKRCEWPCGCEIPHEPKKRYSAGVFRICSFKHGSKNPEHCPACVPYRPKKRVGVRGAANKWYLK